MGCTSRQNAGPKLDKSLKNCAANCADPKVDTVESLCRMTEYTAASKTSNIVLSKRHLILKALLIEFANGF